MELTEFEKKICRTCSKLWSLAHPESNFVDAANNLRNLAYCHDEQI